MKARAAGGEGGHAPGHNGGPEQGPDGADTSHDAFFSRNTIGTDPHGAARQEGRDSAGGTHPPLSGLSASDSPTGKTRLVVCVTEVRGNNTYIARGAAPVTYRSRYTPVCDQDNPNPDIPTETPLRSVMKAFVEFQPAADP